MDQASVKEPSKRRRAPRWRSESGMAGVGLSIAGVIVAVLGASAWWTLDTYRRSVRDSREREIDSLATVLGENLRGALGRDDLAAARRMVVQAAQRHDLERCSLSLGDGTVVADSEPAALSKKPLPERWPAIAGELPAGPDAKTLAGSVVSLSPILVEERGQAVLTVRGPVRFPLLASSEVQTGVALIAAGGFAGLLLIYRTIKQRLGPLGAIRESLHVMATGERDAGVLSISPSLGAEALAWNQLLQETEALRHRQVLDRATERRLPEGGSAGAETLNAADAVWFGLILIDETMRVRYANGAAAALLQTPAAGLVGKELQGVLTRERPRDLILRALGGEMRHRGSLTIETGEGREKGGSDDASASGTGGVLRISVVPMSRSGATMAAVVIEDITQQRASDAARNGFVAQAAHELRSPLTSIRLYQEMLVDEGDANAAVRTKCINVIGQEARRLERMVSDMLSVSQMEAGRLEVVDDDVRLDGLLEELEQDCQAQATNRRQTLRFDLPPKLPVIRGDRDKLMLVLHNLVGNAIKYTPPEGSVTLTVREKADHDPPSVLIDVTDTGYGIRPEECELIFDRFYRAKDARVAKVPGTGLGLALAREVVRIHGGEITVKSQLDHGSTFTVRLPVSRPGAGAMSRAA